MAQSGLPPPGPLIITPGSDQVTAWIRWKDNLESYFIASDIEASPKKKALLLYCGGEDLRKIHETLGDVKKTYEDAVTLLNTYFEEKRNNTFERHVFRNISQNEEESAKEFMLRLKEQSKKCEFNKYSEESALVDQFVEKCTSSKLRRKLLQDSDLNLEKLLEAATAMEITSKHAAAIESSEVKEELNMIKKQDNKRYESKFQQKGRFQGDSRYQRNSSYQDDRRKSFNNREQFRKITCYSCGEEGHTSNSRSCPARNQICGVCNKEGHVEKACWFRNKGNQNKDDKVKVKKLIESSESDEEDYLFRIGNEHHTDVVMKVEGEKMGFLVDSGSGVDVIDAKSFNNLKKKIKVKLYPSKTKIYGYASKEPLRVDGVFYGNINYKGTQQICRFHVMNDENSGCVIGRSTAIELGLLKIPENLNKIYDINESKRNKWKSKYPTVFQGLGKMRDFQLKLNIDKEVEPVSQHLRRIPFHVGRKWRIKYKSY